MTEYLRTMLRITDPDGSRAFYAALGFTFSRDMDIVRDGQLEATNYFYSLGDSENVLELTFNHDGRAYELGSAYGHITIGVDNLDDALAQLKEQGIEPEREPYRVREGGVRNAEERMAAPKRENRSAPSFSGSIMRFAGSARGAEGRNDRAPPPSFPLAKPSAGRGQRARTSSMTVVRWAGARSLRPPWDSGAWWENAEERVTEPNLMVYVCMTGNTASASLLA